MPIEAVGEYVVVTSNPSAEFGRGAGAQVQVIYKSGSNEFHGAVFEFHRNKALNAGRFFVNKTPLSAKQIAAGRTTQEKLLGVPQN